MLNLGINIKKEMKKRKITIKELSSKCEISNGGLCEIITGKNVNPGIQTVIKIAKELNMSLDEIVGQT